MPEHSWLDRFGEEIERAASAAAFLAIFVLLPVCGLVWFFTCKLGWF